MDAGPRTTIEEKRLPPNQADDALVRALRGRQGRLTRSDAVAASGLPVPVVEESLERLLKRYRSHLSVTEEGELLYSFEPSFKRRDVPTLAESLRDFGRVVGKIAMWVFKAWIAVTLVVYFIAFVALLIGAMASGNRRDDDRRGGGFGGGFLWWFLLPDFHRGAAHDAWGARGQRGAFGGKKPKKKFLNGVFDFVFGPPKPQVDPLADERDVLAHIRANGGRITATDLVALFGWSHARAEEEATRLLIDYGGEPEVTESGVLVYSFAELMRSGGEGGRAQRPKRAWERLEEKRPLTGNGAGMNTLIGGFAGFNLLASSVASQWALMNYGLAGDGWTFALTGFPLAFFSIFLGVPVARAIARGVAETGRKARNAQRSFIRRLIEGKGQPVPDAPEMKTYALAFEGEPVVDDAGVIRYAFPRVAEELEARDRLVARVDLGAERRVGEVVFSSADGDDGEGEEEEGRGRPH